ncbi:MAG TPA: RDD family protein [Caldimonas sp.]|nr:RDD family protein [Caldimonas sp.]
MASSPDDNRFAPPQAHVEDVADTAAGGALAGRGTRLVATLLDGLIGGLAFALVSLVTPLTWAPAPGVSVTRFMITNGIVGIVLFMVLHSYLLATRGQTIGKALLKVRIVRRDGSPASFGRIIGLRYLPTTVITLIPLFGGLYAIIDSLLIFRESRRCLHDNIADTIVVKA